MTQHVRDDLDLEADGLGSALQGGCTRVFLFNGQMIFHNEVGQETPGAFTGPTRVTAFAWGLEGDVYPDMII